MTNQHTDQPRPQPWWRFWLIGYAVAAGLMTIVLLLKEHTLAQRALDATPLLLAVIGITAWIGGVGPGLLSVVLATLTFCYYLIPPPDSFRMDLKDVPSLIVFALAALFFCWVSAGLRRSEAALRRAHDEMEAAVVQRTAELARANDQLRAEIIERKQAERALEELAGRLITAQEDERSRIGRELHDHASQRLGILAIKIDQLRMKPLEPATTAPALDELRRQTSEITDDIHALSHRLHSSMLDHLGMVPALQRLVKECSERYSIPIALTQAALPARIPSDVALCLFRVVEETLMNIAKHSHAPSARVDVASVDGGIRLTVADEGVGFDTKILETRAGLGFVSMRERLRLVHGTIRIDSAPQHGTKIDVWVPSPRRAVS